MPILDVNDANEVHRDIDQIFAAESPDARARALRQLFVETLDFDPQSGAVSLAGAPANVRLPEVARRIAGLEVVQVVYVDLSEAQLDTNRVRKAEAAAAAKIVSGQIADDPLLVFTNRDASQLHFVYPDFVGTQPTLRRLVVERDQHRRTADQQVANIYGHWQDTGSIRAALERAFDVEAVTTKFFNEYKRIFDFAMQHVEGFGPDDEDQERKKLFVQTLFNRLMFVYFLSRKGWLTFKHDANYLNALWRDYKSSGDQANFCSDRLSHLFFFGLNNPQSRDLNVDGGFMESAVYGKVPFLNGGLFEKNELDERGGVVVPDGVIEPILSDLFDRFNFTVMESTPFDVEVAVDPEMLGKVFEELVTGRHDSGSYYTPRPVVSFMCREALKGYLEGCDTGLAADVIAAFVDERETDSISPASAPSVATALESVTVVDPACGSGAYLLGMMQELVELRTALFNVGVDPKSLYELKLHVIQRNLYGVDLDEFAVNIAMLRMWLSLVIEYEGDKPEPLPNLDFKVVRGDSLLGPDPSASEEVQGTLGWDVERINELGNLKADYMRAYTGPDKDRLRRQIESLNSEVREALGVTETQGVVDWRVEFAEVFAASNGFDAVIANPPYVRYQNIGPVRHTLSTVYQHELAGNSDLYCYFYARGLQLLRIGGVHVFVCSNSWLDVAYGVSLQQFLVDNSHVMAIYESAIERQFSTALVNTLVSVIVKRQVDEAGETLFVSFREPFDRAVSDRSAQHRLSMSKARLRDISPSGSSKFQGLKWGAKLLRAPSIYHAAVARASARLVKIRDIATVRLGVTTGANDFFYLDELTIKRFGIEARFLRPALRSPREARTLAIGSEHLSHKAFFCNQTMEELEGTGAEQYILWGRSQGYHERPSCSSRRLWYGLGQQLQGRLAMHELIDTTAHTYWALDPSVLFDKNFDVVKTDEKYEAALCASMNSTFFQLVIHSLGRENFGGGLLRVVTHELSNFTVVDPRLLMDIDDSLLSTSNWDVLNPSTARRTIDDAVFEVLQLTQDERDAVYEGVAELVENRRKRAGSVSRPAGAEPQKEKEPFKVVPLASGFAPGVTPENLKDILYEMDVEDYLEKERSSREHNR